MGERIQKILAARGLCSRRKAEQLLLQGRVRVNGQIATLGALAEAADQICVDEKPVPPAPTRVWIMLNKPRGYVTTLADERGRRTAAALIDCGQRVYPVGRLDMASEGLLLFTNDGAMANRLLHPRGEIVKYYEVTVRNAERIAARVCASRLCSMVARLHHRRWCSSAYPGQKPASASAFTRGAIARFAACARQPGWRSLACAGCRRGRSRWGN